MMNNSSSTSSSRPLHLAPSSRTNDSFFIPLIQDASTWDGNICLHLQPYPIPWIFVVPKEKSYQEENNDNNHEEQEEQIMNVDQVIHQSQPLPTSLSMSEAVLQELLHLFEDLKEQDRKIHLILEQNFLQDQSKLRRLLQGVAPLLYRVETNHPYILEYLLSKPLTTTTTTMAKMCPRLQTLVMEIVHSKDSQLQQQQLHELTTFLQHPACRIRGLHLHMAYGQFFNNEDKGIASYTVLGQHNKDAMDQDFLSLGQSIRQSPCLKALKLSGRLLQDGPLTLLLSSPTTFVSRLQKFEVESTYAKILVTEDPNSSSLAYQHNSLIIPYSTLESILTEGIGDSSSYSPFKSNMTHFILRVQQFTMENPKRIMELLSDFSSSLSSSFSSSLSRAGNPLFSSLSYLTIQAALTTPMVDFLLRYLHLIAPSIQELDLEGNDMTSLDLPFLTEHPRARVQSSLRYLERLYLGSNLFSYTNQMTRVERLLQACPRLDVGHSAMPSCGIFMEDHDIENENDNDDWMTGGTSASSRRPLTLFTSWAHGSPQALVWKDWNQHGRYLILEDDSDSSMMMATPSRTPDGLWPLVLEHVTSQFRQRPQRQATLLFQVLQSRAIPIQS